MRRNENDVIVSGGEFLSFWTKSELFIMFIYFLSDWGRISNFSGPSYWKVLKFLSSGDVSWGPPPYFFFYKKEEQYLSTIVDGLRREVTQPSTHWGQWSFVYFDIYLSSFQEKARSWSWGRMGSCQVRRTKYNIHWLSWHFDSTACSKIGVFFCWETEF